MPARACIICTAKAIAGTSRCSTHRRGGGTGPKRHDAEHSRLAKQVVQEANANGTYCALCGKPGTPDDPLEGGHIIALSQGGKSVRSNYRAEHRSHNRSQGGKLGASRFSRET